MSNISDMFIPLIYMTDSARSSVCAKTVAVKCVSASWNCARMSLDLDSAWCVLIMQSTGALKSQQIPSAWTTQRQHQCHCRQLLNRPLATAIRLLDSNRWPLTARASNWQSLHTRTFTHCSFASTMHVQWSECKAYTNQSISLSACLGVKLSDHRTNDIYIPAIEPTFIAVKASEIRLFSVSIQPAVSSRCATKWITEILSSVNE